MVRKKKPRIKVKTVMCTFLEGPWDGEVKPVCSNHGLGIVVDGGHVYWRETVDSTDFLYMGTEDQMDVG